jgi:hypothetical protein
MGKELPKIRDIPAIKGLEEGVDRCVEMNLPVHQEQSLMIFGMNAGSYLAGLMIGKYIAKLCARKGAKLIVHMGVMGETKAFIEETMREAYIEEGKEEDFPKDLVLYHGNKSEVQHASIAKTLSETGCGMYWSTHTDSAIVITLEEAKRIGAVMCGGSGQWSGGPNAPYAILMDHLFITEDIYAAGAFLSGNRDMISSIAGEDYIKFTSLAIIVFALVISVLGYSFSKFLMI